MLRVDVDDIELRVGVLEDRIDRSDLSMINQKLKLGSPPYDRLYYTPLLVCSILTILFYIQLF